MSPVPPRIRLLYLVHLGQTMGDCPQDVQRVQPNPDEYRTPIRELSCPLRWVANIVSRPRI